MRRVAILLLVLAAASGCRKKSAPQYYELESTYSILVSREGDDAYALPEMDQLVTALEAIPAQTVEGPRAAELAAKIKSEKARTIREAQEREAALAAAVRPPEAMPSTPSLFPKEAPSQPPPDGAPVADAGGPTRPWGGMTVAELQQHFGNCFVPGPAKTLPGQPEGTSMLVKDEAACRASFGSTDPDSTTFYVFVKDALIGQTTETRKKTPGEAPKPPPAAPAAADAGPRAFMVIPGAPTPEGYTGIPGVPQGAPAPAPGPQ